MHAAVFVGRVQSIDRFDAKPPATWIGNRRVRFEVIGVSWGPDDRSKMRSRLLAAFDRFIDVRANSDEEIARLLSDLGIDICIDLGCPA